MLACCVSGGLAPERGLITLKGRSVFCNCASIRVLLELTHSQGDASENYDDDSAARAAVLVRGYSASGRQHLVRVRRRGSPLATLLQ